MNKIMRKKLLLATLFVSLFAGKVYSQLGAYTIDVGYMQSIRYELGLMSPISSELITNEESAFGWCRMTPTEFSTGFSPIAYFSIAGEVNVSEDIFSFEYRIKTGYQKMNYKFAGDIIGGSTDVYSYTCDGSKVYFSISGFAEFLMLNSNLRIGLGGGLLAKFPLGVSLQDLDSPFPDMIDFAVNPELKAIYYFGDFYVTAFAGMEIGITPPYLGMSFVTDVRANNTYVGLGVGYHINR